MKQRTIVIRGRGTHLEKHLITDGGEAEADRPISTKTLSWDNWMKAKKMPQAVPFPRRPRCQVSWRRRWTERDGVSLRPYFEATFLVPGFSIERKRAHQLVTSRFQPTRDVFGLRKIRVRLGNVHCSQLVYEQRKLSSFSSKSYDATAAAQTSVRRR